MSFKKSVTQYGDQDNSSIPTPYIQNGRWAQMRGHNSKYKFIKHHRNYRDLHLTISQYCAYVGRHSLTSGNGLFPSLPRPHCLHFNQLYRFCFSFQTFGTTVALFLARRDLWKRWTQFRTQRSQKAIGNIELLAYRIIPYRSYAVGGDARIPLR